MAEVDSSVQVKFKGDEEFQTAEILGKRKGYLRLKFGDGSSKWVDLSTVTMKYEDNLKLATGGSSASIPEAAAVEEEVEAADEPVAPAEPAPGAVEGFTEKVRGLNYYDQAGFFLNAYWNQYEAEKSNIFDMACMMAKQDRKGDDGMCLDEVNAMKILQDLDMALSRPEYLAAMRKIDVNNDRKMSMLELLLYKYKISPADLMLRPQTGMTDELEAALEDKENAEKALENLNQEKEELQKQADAGGVQGMKARAQLGNFKVKEFKDAAWEIKQAEKKIAKARKSPELRRKGDEYIAERRGILAAPKQAVGASGVGGEDAKKVDFAEQIWKEDMLFWIREASYKQQAGFFLNAYWDDISEMAEVVWDYALSMGSHDKKKGEDGSVLDENSVANFMRENVEDFDLTATALRKKLANEICLNNDKKMSLIEFLLNTFNLEVNEMMTRPQGEPSDTVRNMKVRLKEIDAEESEWKGKVAAMEQLAAAGGVKAMGAKNQIAQGYGQKELRELDDERIKCNKKLTKAENSNDMQEPGFLWMISREEQFIAENPQHRG